MRNVSFEFLEEIIKPSRTVDAKIVINGYTITSNDIISYEINSSLTDNDVPTIGSAVASSVKFEVTKSSLPMIYVGQKLEFYAGLLVNGTMEWVRVGTFKTTAEYVTKKKLTVEIEAFDEMYWLGNIIYESDLSYPTTVATMMSELVSKYGLSFSPDMYAFEERRTHESLEAFTYGELEAYWYQPRITDDIVFHIDPTEQEYSIRSILSQMALLTSSNVVIDSFGDIVFRFLKPTDFEITGENYVDYKRLSEGDIYISQLISRNPELEQTFVSGANTGVAITVENSGIVSQVQNDDIRNRVYPLTYTPYDMTCQGMPHLEIGDTIKFVEVDDTESVLFIVNYSFEYNGGFRNKFTVKAPEKDNVETTPFRSASSSISGETIRLTNQTLEQAIANASELITGNAGGHVVTVTDPITGKPQELLILVDSDDVNTATQLWRWNAGGLGFSSTGYDGNYALAMTSDGKIVADAINASELSAIVANLGTIVAGRIQDNQSNSFWDLNTGVIQLNVNSLKINSSDVATQNYVNDQVDSINSANANLVSNLDSNWEQGNIDGAGGLTNSDFHIRTKGFYPIRQGNVYFKIAPLYLAKIVVYDQGYNFVSVSVIANEGTFLLGANSYFKVVVERANSALIEPSAINTAELKVENSDVPTRYTPYFGDLTLDAIQDYFVLEVTSTKGWSVESVNYTTTLEAKVYLYNEDVTFRFENSQFTWLKLYPDDTLVSLGVGKTITLTGTELEKTVTIICEFEIYDTIYTLTTYNGDGILTIGNDLIQVIGYQ